MFHSFAQSWKYTKLSYSLILGHKKLIIFPLISTIAAIIVSLSFFLPIWQSGTLDQWKHFMDDDVAAEGNLTIYLIAFFFYFCNYFAIVFFNTGLIANVFRIINGEEPSIAYGLSFALKRLPQILAWSLVSAIIGVVLKAIENSHEKISAIIVAILGSAWTALTFFVIPVIVIDGVGPLEAFKRSVKTLKSTWGTALIGNFHLGFIGFLIMLPIIIISALLIWLAIASGSTAVAIIIITIGVIVILLTTAATTAADTIFKALLFAYATGQSIPQNIDATQFQYAFQQKND